jgi:hypothetical protein
MTCEVLCLSQALAEDPSPGSEQLLWVDDRELVTHPGVNASPVGTPADRHSQRDATGPIVDRVVSAEQDPIVGREPVVVESVAEIGHALCFGPTQRCSKVRRQRFGEQDVVVNR